MHKLDDELFSPTSLDFALISVELIVFFAVCRDLVDVLDLMKMTTVDLQVTRRVMIYCVG